MLNLKGDNMRRLFFAVSIAFLFISCNNGVTENSGGKVEANPFIGTWQNDNTSYRIAFTETVASGYYPNGDIYWTGPYTYDDKDIKVKLDASKTSQEMLEGWGDTLIVYYWFDGGNLVFSGTTLTKIS